MQSPPLGYTPWIGDSYWKSGYEGCRLLVVGESNYALPTKDSGKRLTIRNVEEFGTGGERNAFFTLVARLFPDVLRVLQPRVVLFLGNRLWDRAPPKDCNICNGPPAREMHAFDIPGSRSKAVAFHVRHPMGGANKAESRKLFTQLFECARSAFRR